MSENSPDSVSSRLEKHKQEKEKIEAAVKELDEVLKGEDTAEIQAKTEALMTASQKMGEKIYADMQAQEAAAASDQPAGSQDDDIIDAEVKEKKD